jgi:hypothetical protein
MMQTYRAFASLTLATALLAAPNNTSAQHSRAHAARHGSVAFAVSAEPNTAGHRMTFVASGARAPGGDMLDSVRRQPRDLLNGIELSRAERKAVNGIVRKNGKQLRMLEARRNASSSTQAQQHRVELEIARLRDRERMELRKVLSPPHRRQFDHNLALIASSGL